MNLPQLDAFFMSLPKARRKGNSIECRCPLCGDSKKSPDAHHFNIKVDVGEKEPIVYNCYRALCKGGVLTTDTLNKEMGCTDMGAILELAKHNKTVKFIKKNGFGPRSGKDYVTLNLDTQVNRDKVKYLNNRLGWNLTPPDLKKFKIQLSIMDYIRINKIKKVPFDPRMMDLIERYCIGFISAYDDYIIFRDISKENFTGKRYINYRIDTVGVNETKMYIHPTEVDLLSPEPATLFVSEGIISLYGAKYNTDLRSETPNTVWAANCGAHFLHTIEAICAMYGFTNIILNIISDSEIGRSFYDKLRVNLQNSIIIEEMNVYKNSLKEDCGHKASEIVLDRATLIGKKSSFMTL